MYCVNAIHLCSVGFGVNTSAIAIHHYFNSDRREFYRPVDQHCSVKITGAPRVGYNTQVAPCGRAPGEATSIGDTWKSGVRKSALRGRCTSAVKLLAEPAPRRVKKSGEVSPWKVRQSAIKGKLPSQVTSSALPLLKRVKLTKGLYYRTLGPRQRAATNNLEKQLLEIYEKNHPPHGETNDKLIAGIVVHAKCVKSADDECKKRRYICQLSKKDRKKFQTRMIQMGQPREIPKPPRPDRGPKKPMEAFKPLLKILAKPQTKIKPSPRDPYKVNPAALSAVASSWVVNLARHREPRPPAPVYDFRGNEILPPRKWDIEARRRVIASERMGILAIPKRTKKKAAEDVKEDPYMVSKAALTAVCTERLNELARPISRK